MPQMQKVSNLVLDTDLINMKKTFTILYLLIVSFLFAQEQDHYWSTNLFYGTALEHDTSLKEVIDGNPFGIELSYTSRNTKQSNFNSQYNFPDKGYSFLYQNMGSKGLGKSYGLYRHYTFFLGERNAPSNWFIKTAFGLAYNDNPYDVESNPSNFAIGSNILLSAYGTFGYEKKELFKNISLRASAILIHYSNASFKNPNLGINTIGFNVGLQYYLDENKPFPDPEKQKLKELVLDHTVKYNLVLRGGAQQSKEIGSSTYGFIHASAFISKRFSYKNTWMTGVDYFHNPFIQNYIPYYNETEFKNESASNTDRIGVFIGYAMHFDRFAFTTALGYHVYEPFQYESSIYERVGFRHKLSKHLFTELTLKVNLFRAEGLEFGLGYQF